ncbi:MAG: permease [Aphanocapsa sp. GSE-SYN-MK-11-07L]|jgi:hypothetical protein|nr:permease [Aphanocapsa sp. GSE-SYN-MK-11-07L]
MSLSNQFSSGFTLFLSLLVEAIPFLLLGVVVSGLLLLFVNERKLIALLPRNPLLGALAGSVMGFLFPVCECGNVPVARRLLMQGVSAPVAIGFLLAAPTINPVVMWVTWTAFRDQPEIVVLRVVFSLAIATLVGCIFGTQADLKPFLQPAVAAAMPRPPVVESSFLVSGSYLLDKPGQPLRLDASLPQIMPEAKPVGDRLKLLLENTVQELRELGGILVLGSLIAAVIQVAVPREVVLGLGQGPVISILTMMLLGGIISICSTVDSFFALAFASTFTSGSLLAFLVFGPMFDLKSLGLLLTIFRPRAMIYIVAIVAQMTFLLTLFVNLRLS